MLILLVMYVESEAVVLRQTKTVGGRRMLTLFTKQYGKISAGTSISEKAKSRAALALRPFTYGRYELFKGRDSFSINGAETIKGYYSLGEDIDKFFAASYALELTDRLMPEEQSQIEMFYLLTDFMAMMELRKKSFETLVIGFQVKALQIAGVEPDLSPDSEGNISDKIIARLDKESLDALSYIMAHPLKSLEKLSLKPGSEEMLKNALRSYYSYHLGIDNLKSDGIRVQ